MDILELLIQDEKINKEEGERLRSIANSTTDSLVNIIRESKSVPEKVILEAISKLTHTSVRVIDPKTITKEILDYIPEESAAMYQFVPIGFVEGTLEVGMIDPDDIEARDALNFISSRTGNPYKIFVISESDFDTVIGLYKGLNSEVTKAISQFQSSDADKGVELEKEEITEGDEIAEITELKNGVDVSKKSNTDDDVRIIEDAPVTKIVATILRYATEGNASDVHLEHMRENIRVRFRVDGVLNTSLVLPREVYSAVVARIKILSNMKLDEKRRPQDGRFSAKIDGRKIDFRVSTFPTYYGEKVVMRILDQGKGVKKLSDLGLSEKNLTAILSALKRPYGIILISGPTGSGKTTTLYSMLEEINTDGKNILSLEDPIEYNIEGVNQSQVRPDIGYTFANGLRTTLRQDPDIIMVGEIRDKETAQLAIQAALTGHLVFSTIHTNNAFGVIPRLIDMGVDPYLIAPTLVLAIAQRLVKKRCPTAGIKTPIEGSIKRMIEKEFESVPVLLRKNIPMGDSVYKIAPSPECPNGISGRVSVMEIIEMNKELEEVILSDASEARITEITRKQGYLTMKQDAVLKAMQGDIPFEEINTL